MRPVAIANRNPRLRFARRAVERVIHVLDENHAALARRGTVLDNDGELSLVFLTDPALARIHGDFLDDPTITDVITFEGNPALGTAGEICVSPDAAVRHLAAAGKADTKASRGRPAPKSPDALSRELTLYVVHGWLHLAGYDDLAPAKKRVMRRAEARAMALLEAAGAVPKFQLAR